MSYFPDPLSGWLFLAVLVPLLGVASYTDQRWMTVPKWLTLPLLGLGLLASLLRGAWLGGHGGAVWMLGASGPAVGAVDGLLFGLAGFALGFALFFALWAGGICGGGDVKLVAALGAWIGPKLVFAAVAVSLFFLWLVFFVVVAGRLLRGKRAAGAMPSVARPVSRFRDPSRVVIRYSLVATLATVLVVVWAFRVDLGLRAERPHPAAEVRSDAR
ncbi:MAG: A24 family peptidase [Gemmataceae bacterium]